MSVYRVAPLMDDPFDIPNDAPGRTDDGDVYLRWANIGSYAGWYAVGTRRPKATRSSGFWEKVYALSAAVGNGTYDSVHAIGPGLLSLGGLALTVSSGWAQELIGECLEAHPARWMECMAPVMFEVQVFPCRDVDGRWQFIAAGSGNNLADMKWATSNKHRARLWVRCCSKMLRDDRFDEVQHRFLARVGPEMLTPELRGVTRFAAVRDTWSWSQEQQALWATAIVMSLADSGLANDIIVPPAANHNWRTTYAEASGPADATLRALRDALAILSSRGVPEHIVARLGRTLEALPNYFGLQP